MEQGHAAVRFVNPTTGGDVMPTIRAEFHRFRPGTETRTTREVGSSVYQVFEGRGRFVLDGEVRVVEKGDLVVVPSWTAWQIQAETGCDLFKFGDQPIVEKLNFNRTFVEGEEK